MMSQTALIEQPITETLERLRANSNLNSTDWYDLVGLNFCEYLELRMNQASLPEKNIESLAKYFDLRPQQIVSGQIDFKNLTLRMERGSKDLPEHYSKAAYGRQRTSITSLDYIEHYGGWRLRHDAINKLNISENAMLDPFAPISMKFITDLCSYLALRQFQKQDFYNMGAFAFISNSNSVIGKILAEMPNSAAAYDFFFNDCLKLFEQNCTYKITGMSENELTVEYLTNVDVAAESGVRHLGNQHVCQLKAGFIATIPKYLGLPPAQITKTSCVHCGDAVCTLHLDISDANQAQKN